MILKLLPLLPGANELTVKQHLGTNYSEILIKIHHLYIKENKFDDDVCKMSAIWFRPDCV